MTEIILLAVGIAIVAILSIIAWRLQGQVRLVERRQKQQQETITRARSAHQEYLKNSIQVLAQGLVDNQLTLTEGAIRISVLMSNLEKSETHREEFSAFFQLADATAHIPILDAWKKLPKKDQFHLDKERLRIEDKFRDFVLDAAQRVRAANL